MIVKLYHNYLKRIYFSVLAVARGASLSEMNYLGIVGIMDPPREAVRASVTTLQSTGIRVKMVTGDAQETACAIAKAVGLQVWHAKGKVVGVRAGRGISEYNGEKDKGYRGLGTVLPDIYLCLPKP